MKRIASVAALLAAITAPASAELWAYVDGRGVAHFANRSIDSRWQRVLGEGPRPQRVPGKRDDAGRLLIWLEISPAAKAAQPWLREAARRHGVDAELLKAVIAVESGFDARAVSPRGAIGLMQITAESGERYAGGGPGMQPVAERLLDPKTNIDTGARMLADLLRRHRRIDHALAAWNAGEGAVRRHGGLPPISETQAHVQQVLELYWALLQHTLGRNARTLALPS